MRTRAGTYRSAVHLMCRATTGLAAAGRSFLLVCAALAGGGAPAEQVFRTMTDCAQALQFVPHLRRCSVLDTAPDGSWQIILHEADYRWFLPRASYVFRADYQPYARVSFSAVRGDFAQNDGVWQLTPRRDGAATVVTYRAHVVPRLYVPGRMVLESLTRDLPALLQGLRARCEAP